MKNLAKVLLVLAFSTSAFAGSMAVTPNPVDVTWIGQQSSDQQQNWMMGLSMDQYNSLSEDVQKWVQQNLTDTTKRAELGLN